MIKHSVYALILSLFCGVTAPLSATAQTDTVYRLTWTKELVLTGGGIGLVLFGNHLRDRTPDITIADLEEEDIPGFDRIATEFSSDRAVWASDWTLSISNALPFALLIPRTTRRKAGKIGLMYAQTILFTQGFTQIIKSTALRPRPYVFDENLPLTTILKSNDRAAFLSGHTSLSAASTFFFARVFSDYFPASRARPYVWTGAALLPALTGYLRVRGGKHYPSDVIAGYALGAIVGYFVPVLHRKRSGVPRLSLNVGQTGFYASYRF